MKIMAHIVAGYPSLENSHAIAERILRNVDILEVQIPFSDPIADGPIIARANAESLEQGITVNGALELIRSLIKIADKPIYIMTYFNIIHHYGILDFCKKVADIGVQGLIVPDYPFDEDPGNGLLDSAKENNLNFIQIIAPTTTDERMQLVARKGQGFLYCMARTGITGSKTDIDNNTISYLQRVKHNTDLPIAVGFGLSEKSQLEALEPYADIAVIGSALINIYKNKSLNDAVNAIDAFFLSLR